MLKQVESLVGWPQVLTSLGQQQVLFLLTTKQTQSTVRYVFVFLIKPKHNMVTTTAYFRSLKIAKQRKKQKEGKSLYNMARYQLRMAPTSSCFCASSSFSWSCNHHKQMNKPNGHFISENERQEKFELTKPNLAHFNRCGLTSGAEFLAFAQ